MGIGLKEVLILILVAAPLVAAYPAYKGAVDSIYSLDDSIDDGDQYVAGEDDTDIVEYRLKVTRLRDQLAGLYDQGLFTGQLREEVGHFLAGLSDERIASMTPLELKMAEERLEHYIKMVSGDFDDSLDHYSYDDSSYDDVAGMGGDIDDRRVRWLIREIIDKQGDVYEYRVKAQTYGVSDVMDDLDRAESLLDQALNILRERGAEGYDEAWSLYLEADLILDTVDEVLDHLVDD